MERVVVPRRLLTVEARRAGLLGLLGGVLFGLAMVLVLLVRPSPLLAVSIMLAALVSAFMVPVITVFFGAGPFRFAFSEVGLPAPSLSFGSLWRFHVMFDAFKPRRQFAAWLMLRDGLSKAEARRRGEILAEAAGKDRVEAFADDMKREAKSRSIRIFVPMLAGMTAGFLLLRTGWWVMESVNMGLFAYAVFPVLVFGLPFAALMTGIAFVREMNYLQAVLFMRFLNGLESPPRTGGAAGPPPNPMVVDAPVDAAG